MEYVLLAMVITTFGYYLYQGYSDATRPPPTLRDSGGGIMVPVCARCHAKLVPIARKQGGGLADVLAIGLGILGIVVLLAHLIAGLALLALAIVIHYAGKSAVTVLTCPACGQIDRTLR